MILLVFLLILINGTHVAPLLPTWFKILFDIYAAIMIIGQFLLSSTEDK